MNGETVQSLRDAIQTAQMEAMLGLWLSGIAVALVIVLAAVVCHDRRDTKAKFKLASYRHDLPQHEQRQAELADSVEQSALAADYAKNGAPRPPPAETRVFGVQNGSE